MSETFKPTTQDELCDIIKTAAADQTRLDAFGHHSKQLIGNPVAADAGLDLSGFTGVRLYEPEELVFAAGVGMPVAQARQLLAKNNQDFAFEPPDFSYLLNSNDAGSLGGMVASGLAGSRRLLSGSVRDHVLGVKAVSGRGEAFKTGGRVMKNVTGYDLPKLLTGSWGTLGLMTQATFKVLPKAETEATLVIAGLDNEAAIRAMAKGLSAPVEVSGAAHVPKTRTLLRLEGFEPSVRARLKTLKTVIGKTNELDVFYGDQSATIWETITNASLLSPATDNAVWRVSTAPAHGAKLLAEIEKDLEVTAFFDWGGGLLWVEVLNQPTACAAQIRGAVAKFGGHATLIRASEKSRAGCAAFQPQSAGLAALSDRVKASFDPANILNPGRMYRRNETA